MQTIDATRKKYNAAGVHPTTDPDDPRSHFAVDKADRRKQILIGVL